jgi:hypothetical protein
MSNDIETSEVRLFATFCKGLKGYSPMSLRNYRTFYRTYPQIQQSIIVELQKTGIETYK